MLRQASSYIWEAGIDMENKGTIFLQDSQIQGLLANFLKFSYVANKTENYGEQHLDEDTAAAFVEGNLNIRQSEPVVTHLVACSFCRHITAELIKLDLAFAETEPARVESMEKTEPAKISEVLSGLLSRIFGSNEGAVFAHQEDEKDSENKEPENAENPDQEKIV
jgi:hypothetical protein